MKTRHPLILTLLCLGAGCVTVKQSGDIEPVDPKPSGQSGYTKTKTVRPTLVWRAPATNTRGGSTYDLIIYEGVPTKLESGVGFLPGQVLRPGKEVYYRENLAGTSHTLEKQLIPYCYYCWTVRTRTGTNVSPWATWSREKLLGGEHDIYWAFKTPGPEAR